MTAWLLSRVMDGARLEHYVLSSGTFGVERWVLITSQPLFDHDPELARELHDTWVALIAPTL